MPKEYRDSLSLNEPISLHDRKNDYESEGGRNSDGTVTGTVNVSVNVSVNENELKSAKYTRHDKGRFNTTPSRHRMG